MAAPKGGSRTRLLDAAEQLFAERGFDATSTREIAALAGDTLGTLSYHFSSKDKLLVEVVHRRFDELTALRRETYNSFVAAAPDGVPALGEVIAAIMLPFIERALGDDVAWASYTTLLSRVLYVGNPSHYAAVAALTDPLAREMLDWLRKAAPGCAEADLGYAYQFMIGCMMDACSHNENDRIQRITDGACSASDFQEMRGRILRFVEAGVKAVLGI